MCVTSIPGPLSPHGGSTMTELRRPKPASDPLEEFLPDLENDSPSFAQNGTGPLDTGPDPFDPETLRLPPDYGIAFGAKKALADIPVRRPAKEWFFRTHPTYQLETTLIELKETRELY